MPPETPPVPSPSRSDALPFLAHHGILPRVPSLRSSDFKTVASNPFAYYLTRRLGITRRFSWSAALSRGSWTHKCFELDPLHTPSFTETPNIRSAFHTVLESRLAELSAISTSLSLPSTTHEEILARERNDAETAFAWYATASSLRVSSTVRSFRHYLAHPTWRDLGPEITLECPLPSNPSLTLKGVADRLLHNIHTNELWIADLKTTSLDPRDRLSLCSHEFQASHYLSIARLLVTDPSFRSLHDLPDDIRVGGMIHIAMLKPTITLCSDDRPYRLVDFTPSRGPNKGITRQEKEFYGEPSLDHYLARCDRWYKGTHEYSDLAPLRESSPPTNISFTPASILDNPSFPSYTARLNLLTYYATLDPQPDNFPYDATQFQAQKKLSPWAPFAICPVEHWPEIMAREGFIIAHRDEDPSDAQEEDPPSEDPAP